MTASLQRRLTLFDAMVLMAMIGTGVASLRGFSVAEILRLGIRPRPNLLPVLRHGLVGPFLPCGLAWTLAVLLLRLGHPRPPRRHLARQPGTVACVASVSVVGTGALALLLVMIVQFYKRTEQVALTDRFMTRFMEAMAPYMGTGVLVAWMTSVLNRMWRPEPSWIDRMGRAIGVFWVATIPIFAWPYPRLIL
jgi:hypothetical protein